MRKICQVRAPGHGLWKPGGDRLRRGERRLFPDAGVPEITEAAFFEGAVGQFQGDLWRPTVAGLGDVIHDTHDAGDFVNHDFAKKAFAGGGNFRFAHAARLRQKKRMFNVGMGKRPPSRGCGAGLAGMVGGGRLGGATGVAPGGGDEL